MSWKDSRLGGGVRGAVVEGGTEQPPVGECRGGGGRGGWGGGKVFSSPVSLVRASGALSFSPQHNCSRLLRGDRATCERGDGE